MKVDIERLLARLGIEAKRQGKEWVALCPNKEHADRSPSWRIRDEPTSAKHGYHKCWPCSFQGSVVGLVQHVLAIDEPSDAKRWIEGAAGVEQKEIEGVDVVVKARRLRFRLPAEVLLEPFEEWPQTAREYWLERGLEPWQVERWGIGYAVHGRLQGRIVIPSRDRHGRAVRYTARTFVGDRKRYLEPEPNELANGSAMFGEQHWPPLSERDLIFVIEGAVNGLALEAELPGIYVAATAGSSMRGLYGAKLSTWPRICTMTDPDAAGDKIAEEVAGSVGRHSRVARLRLPEGTDQAALRSAGSRLPPGTLGAIVREWMREANRAVSSS